MFSKICTNKLKTHWTQTTHVCWYLTFSLPCVFLISFWSHFFLITFYFKNKLYQIFVSAYFCSFDVVTLRQFIEDWYSYSYQWSVEPELVFVCVCRLNACIQMFVIKNQVFFVFLPLHLKNVIFKSKNIFVSEERNGGMWRIFFFLHMCIILKLLLCIFEAHGVHMSFIYHDTIIKQDGEHRDSLKFIYI